MSTNTTRVLSIPEAQRCITAYFNKKADLLCKIEEIKARLEREIQDIASDIDSIDKSCEVQNRRDLQLDEGWLLNRAAEELGLTSELDDIMLPVIMYGDNWEYIITYIGGNGCAALTVGGVYHTSTTPSIDLDEWSVYELYIRTAYDEYAGKGYVQGWELHIVK